MNLTGVGWHICASHEDRMTKAVHGHTWEVIAWHSCPDHNDAVILQTHLQMVCESFDHKTIPAELARGEDLAAAILRLSPVTCVVKWKSAGRFLSAYTQKQA